MDLLSYASNFPLRFHFRKRNKFNLWEVLWFILLNWKIDFESFRLIHQVSYWSTNILSFLPFRIHCKEIGAIFLTNQWWLRMGVQIVTFNWNRFTQSFRSLQQIVHCQWPGVADQRCTLSPTSSFSQIIRKIRWVSLKCTSKRTVNIITSTLLFDKIFLPVIYLM